MAAKKSPAKTAKKSPAKTGKKPAAKSAKKSTGKASRGKASRGKAPAKKAARGAKWSQHVTETSNAMDVAGGTFAQRSAAKIARDVEADAERSKRRKSSPYRSAMSMLTFYINRAGQNLTPERRAVLEHAKEILREEFGPKR